MNEVPIGRTTKRKLLRASPRSFLATHEYRPASSRWTAIICRESLSSSCLQVQNTTEYYAQSFLQSPCKWMVLCPKEIQNVQSFLRARH